MIVLDLETISTIDKQKLKKKLDFAFRQIVSEWRAEHWGTEEIYAMSFRSIRILKSVFLVKQ